MTLTRLLTTAAAAALMGFPAVALAAGNAPPSDSSAPAAASAAPAAAALPTLPKIVAGADIYSTLKTSGQFTILVKALDATGLAPVLQRYPNLTFFAPTDAAFQALPADELAKLTAPGVASANQLQQILKYHLVNAQLDSTKIKGAKGPVPTVEGQPVVLDGSNDVLMVNNADILEADVHTANGGVVHAIDKVLVPSDSPYYVAQAAPAPTPAAAAPATP